MPPGMSGKMLAFCRAYVRLQSAEAAAREAGYSEKRVKASAYKLLQRDDVRAEVRRLSERVERNAVKDATDVVNRLSLIAFVDPFGFLKPDDLNPGEYVYKAPHELTDEQKACVKRIFINKDFNTKTGEFIRETYSYELKDSERALENMGRHYGIFDDKLRLTGRADNPFSGVSTEKLLELKQAIAKIMTAPAKGVTIEGQGRLLRDERKRNGAA